MSKPRRFKKVVKKGEPYSIEAFKFYMKVATVYCAFILGLAAYQYTTSPAFAAVIQAVVVLCFVALAMLMMGRKKEVYYEEVKE